jgi:lipopolysaccharide export system protein LptC
MGASITIGADQHSWAFGDAQRERMFRRAGRHSRLVRLMRFGIPTMLVVGVAGFAAVQALDPLKALSRLPTVKKLGVSGTRITMDTPRLSGFTRDKRAYDLTAAAAAQDLTQPHFMELQQVRASFDLEDKSHVTVTADSGAFDSRAEALTLTQKVRVVSSMGTEVRMRQAQFDLRSGTVTTNDPVEIHMPQGRLDAQQMEVREGGDVINFRGGVRLVLDGDATVASANPRQ